MYCSVGYPEKTSGGFLRPPILPTKAKEIRRYNKEVQGESVLLRIIIIHYATLRLITVARGEHRRFRRKLQSFLENGHRGWVLCGNSTSVSGKLQLWYHCRNLEIQDHCKQVLCASGDRRSCVYLVAHAWTSKHKRAPMLLLPPPRSFAAFWSTVQYSSP